MSMIRNSVRAFAVALAPLAVYHGTMTATALASYVASGVELPTHDRAFLIFLLRLAIDAVLLFFGHLLLRAFRTPTRFAYAFMGGIATATGYAFALRYEIWIASPVVGTRLTGAILPVCVGMIASFLYAQFAGREPTAPRRPWSSSAALHPRPDVEPAAYDGPVQVRTSIAAISIAATVPAVLAAALAMPLGMLAFGNFMPFERQADAAIMQVFQLAFPAQVVLATLFATIVPSAIVVCATHGIARGLGWLRARHYALIGASVSCSAALVLIMMVDSTFLFPAAAGAGGLMGAIYRQFAGLEPAALPDPVLVDDAARLVGADHPTRRQHAVITNG
jgi:hypothetical protein